MMDQSYWSRIDVVEASRNFVCIRLATYEDAEEVKFLTRIFRGRSGQLENTVFALLDSDGKTRLSRTGRSPDFAYWGASSFVKGLNKIARDKKSEKKRYSDKSLPLVKNVSLGLNVASCDGIQMIVVAGENEKMVDELSQKALPLAWNDKVGGQFVFVVTNNASDLKPLGIQKIENGIYVVNPGKFGMSGKIVAKFDENFDTGQAEQKLTELAKNYSVTKNYRQHIQSGIRQGIEWKSQTPVTDQESLRAKNRARRR